MQRFAVSRGLALLGLVALGACDSPMESARQQPEDLAGMVEALGFRGDMVQDFGHYVLVEGDIYITRESSAAHSRPGAAIPWGRVSSTAPRT